MENKVTCSFVLDRTTYDAYKKIVSEQGQSVKGNLVRYMKSVIQTNSADVPNAADNKLL